MPVILLAACLFGCVSSGGGDDWRLHYVSFGATPPQGNRVTVCHAYTCKEQTAYTFSRQDLADLTGTTIETCIRIMSRWHKDGLVSTEEAGFVIVDAPALRALSEG